MAIVKQCISWYHSRPRKSMTNGGLMTLTHVKSRNDDIEIGINAKSRKDVAQSLSRVLADTYVLQLKTKYYHWNVTGALFHSLHTLFDAQYQELSNAVDELAERIRALGVTAPGTFHEFSGLSSLKEDKYLPTGWNDMVYNLTAAHEQLICDIREKLTLVQKAGDEGTADLFIRRIQEHEKAAWMLRSHTA